MSDASIFLIIYGITTIYFAGVMVRLMLVLAPIACILGGIAVSSFFETYMEVLTSEPKKSRLNRGEEPEHFIPRVIAASFVVGITILLCFYAVHCSWVSSEAYSSPSIVLAARGADGSRIIFDDYREAYYWLRQNTPENAKVMSWWDYGYQIGAMANRTVIVDNNTWNNTHIATVGRAMSSSEDVAFTIMKSLDVSYVLVIFGGLAGYAGDDINKFLWMIRIAGGVFPDVVEKNYFAGGSNQDFKVGRTGAPALLNSFLYKLCYYGFGQVATDYGKPPGFDRVRNEEIGNKDFELEYVKEVFTSEHWIVRIYQVKDEPNRP